MRFLLLLFLVHRSSAVIYHLNFTEYSKMPELYTMDDYDTCVSQPGGTYCLLDADLYTEEQSDLMTMIQEYSDYEVKHFNHTQVHRAVCVQKTCKDFMQNRSLENEEDLKAVLQECVDDSLWKDYRLHARLASLQYCKRHEDKRIYSYGDFIVGGFYLLLVVLNAVGTSYDILKGDSAGNPYLLSFSMRKNWKKLIAPSGVGPEPRLNRLKLFNGMRTLTMVCVYFSHTVLVNVAAYVKNPWYIEKYLRGSRMAQVIQVPEVMWSHPLEHVMNQLALGCSNTASHPAGLQLYDDPAKYILLNGTLVTYTFFVMSGFLLAFNFELHAEKHRISLWEWPKGMLMRWLRLTPTYALVMFTVMTINRHLGDGPMWNFVVNDEGTACAKYWWAHLLYINNYIYDDSDCFPQSWYLAADTQLFGLGLLVCILFRKPRTQMMALAVMLVVALAIPAAHVYYQNLGAVVHMCPETFRTLFRFNRTFRIIFVAGHTNMSTYCLGIAGGLLTYHWLKDEKTWSQRLGKYPWIMWATFPIAVGTILTGGFFYMDNYEPSTLVKIIYGAVHKPVFQMNVCIIIICCIFKVESVYRGILEWRGFTWTGRVSYAGFLLHSLFQRGFVGSQRQPSYVSDYNILTLLGATTFLSFGIGALLWVTFESPMAVLTKNLLSPQRRGKNPEKEPEQITEEANAKDVTTKV